MREMIRGKRLIAVFLLGVVLLNFPLLAVVEASGQLFGLPALFVYLFGAWAGLIVCLAAIVERRPSRPRAPEGDHAR
jgi:hypothetical protein